MDARIIYIISPFHLILFWSNFQFSFLKIKKGDFPGGPLVKNLPYNAGDVGLIPGQGTEIPHAVGQLSPRDTTTELTCLN